jgi:hypothetical protein
MTSFLVLLSLLIPVLVLQVKWFYRRRQIDRSSWQAILSRVHPVNLDGLRAIAECSLQPAEDQLCIEPAEMWKIVGGREGIAHLKSNAAAMLELAIYAERWSQTDGASVAEMIRRDAVRLNKAITQIQLGALLHFSFTRASLHLQEAASSYYLIRSRLLGLYNASQTKLVPRLTQAL